MNVCYWSFKNLLFALHVFEIANIKIKTFLPVVLYEHKT
jgi:hypothetical protein